MCSMQQRSGMCRRCIAGAAALIAMQACGTRAPSPSPTPEPVPAQTQHSYVPAAGFVPDAEVAIQIARAVLERIYGARQIEGQLPLTARMEGEAWIVTGTLPAGRLGGTARIEIAKQDGRILRVTHGR